MKNTFSWTDKYKVGDSIKIREPEGYIWDAEVIAVDFFFIEVKWRRNYITHPQWRSYNRAYEWTFERFFGEIRIIRNNMDIQKLKELCAKHTKEVSFNGFEPFSHKVIDAEPFLEEIHTTSTLSKEDFIKNINEKNFMTPEYESIFHSIKYIGVFMMKGYEQLKGKAYIEHESLNWL